ncbi:unnamed protein product [Ranitomeya imitator]|uniref:BTB domain-containing protein n=4 Tax=Tetrapoda TaxID=32523 RepID=A0ABN9LGR8_9NEOB|nr:unnamed protein product [Ranitomeya imitator]
MPRRRQSAPAGGAKIQDGAVAEEEAAKASTAYRRRLEVIARLERFARTEEGGALLLGPEGPDEEEVPQRQKRGGEDTLSVVEEQLSPGKMQEVHDTINRSPAASPVQAKDSEELEFKTDDLENRSRSNNLRIIGVPEKVEGNNPTEYIEAWLKNSVWGADLTNHFSVERAHRVPTRPLPPGSPPRALLAKILDYRDRETLLRKARISDGLSIDRNRISIYPDYSASVQKLRMRLIVVADRTGSKNMAAVRGIARKGNQKEKLDAGGEVKKVCCPIVLSTLDTPYVARTRIRGHLGSGARAGREIVHGLLYHDYYTITAANNNYFDIYIVTEEMSGESVVSSVVPATTTRTTSFKCASTSSKYVKLNVGGALYYTTMQTLTKQDTMLKAMFSGRMEVLTDSEGWILIDRCGKHFGTILNYLRDGAVPLPETRREIEELLAEAKYYLVQGLADECQASLQNKDVYEPFCKVPVITSSKEEQKLIATSNKPAVKLLYNRSNNKYSYTRACRLEETRTSITSSMDVSYLPWIKVSDGRLWMYESGEAAPHHNRRVAPATPEQETQRECTPLQSGFWIRSNSDDNMLKNIELFDKLSLRFNGRVLFIKDVIGDEICCWSFYGQGRKIAEVCCTSIVYATEKKQTKVEFPEARIYEETLNILLYEAQDGRGPDNALLEATGGAAGRSHHLDDDDERGIASKE